MSPLTGLPGNNRILREIERPGSRPVTGFAVLLHATSSNFKAVNDAYGFARGDKFIITLARKLVTQAVRRDRDHRRGRSSGTSVATTYVVICSPDLILQLADQRGERPSSRRRRTRCMTRKDPKGGGT